MIQLLEHCNLCDWGESTLISCIAGLGPIPCDIMLIGDMPILDRKTMVLSPLSNASISMLTKAMASNQMDLLECYITNVMHCSPPNDESPTTGEIKACIEHLKKELDIVKPKFILLMGAMALKAVLGKANLGEIHGTVIRDNGRTYMPTFHPTTVLHDPSKKLLFDADIKRFANLLRQGSPDNRPELNLCVVKNFTTLETLLKDIEASRAVSFDLETNSLDMYTKNSAIHILGIGTPQAQWIIPLEFKESPWKGDMYKQKVILQSICSVLKGKKVIGHNGKFDNKWLKAIYGIRFPITFDTMLAMHILDENSRLGLKYLARQFFNAPEYDIKEEEKLGSTSANVLYTYCGYDVYYTLKLYEKLKAELQKPENATLKKVFLEILMPLSSALEVVEANGVYLNPTRFKNMEKELIEKKNKCLTLLKSYADINWNSSKQVADVLYTQLGLEIVERTAKNNSPSIGESAMIKLKGKHPCIEVLLEYKKITKQINSFIDGWKKYLHEDGCMHPTFNIAGTKTGRLSCNDPNIQQVPKDVNIRSIITARPGYTFVEIDYSQLELRLIADISGDPVMCQTYNEDKIDLHTKTASIVTGKPVDEISKKERSEAKPINFGYCYGMGWRTFIEYARTNYDIIFDEATAQKIRNDFFNMYTGLPLWHDYQREKVHKSGYVTTKTGRIRHLSEINSMDKKVVLAAERQAINFVVQSLGSDICVSALIEIVNTFDTDKVKVVGNVHDALLFEVRSDILEEIVPRLKAIMERPRIIYDKFGLKFKVPIVAEVSISPNGWGTGK